jgi:hypothetical protein
MSVSFDGTCFVQSKPTSPTFYYKCGDSEPYKTAVIEGDSVHNVYTAVIDSTILAAQGANVYSIGSEGVLVKLELPKPLDSPATGIWADRVSVWVATQTRTFLSNDVGWTWIEQPGTVAVGPGIYVSTPAGPLSVSSSDSFVESAGFPLRLNNSGALSSDTTNFRSAFEYSGVSSGSTVIEADTRSALSPNRLFLLTQDPEGVFKVHINVWNTDAFAAWCSTNASACKEGRIKYCESFGIRAGPWCTPESPPETGSKFLWVIILSVVVGAGLLIAVLAYLRKKSKTLKPRTNRVK